MRKFAIALSLSMTLLIGPASAGEQSDRAMARYPAPVPGNYAIASGGTTAIETTGSAPDEDVLRNEQPVLIEQPAPSALDGACAADPDQTGQCDDEIN
jgi:hypothetical protein